MSLSKEALDDMRKITIMTGTLSEVHVKNMNMYPFVFFDNVKSVRIEYDIDVKSSENSQSNNSYVVYHLKTKGGKKSITNLDKRLEALKNSISTLLWSGIKVSVYLNGSHKEL
jgi:hypothetical protein